MSETKQIIETNEKPADETGRFRKHWKLSCAVVYLAICIFDFLIMPTVYANYNKKIDYTEVYAQINNLESPQAQVALINKIDYSAQSWEPITLLGGGLIHISFGAILTGAAVRESKIKSTKTYNN